MTGGGRRVTMARRPSSGCARAGWQVMLAPMADDVADDWDFYPCLVDGTPASIFLNLGFEAVAPLPAAATRYRVRIHMRDGDEHGMGSTTEATALHAVEDHLVASAVARGLRYVGRLRHHGVWELVFYGAAAHQPALEAAVAAVDALGGRDVDVGVSDDAAWAYYTAFLLPDPERRQWMQDRRLVAVLEEHGDVGETPRRVDHWAYFPSAEARARFLAAAQAEGFVGEIEPEATDATPADPPRYCAHVYRLDAAELSYIHDVVMGLVELAEEQGGDYDGWETSVEAPALN